MALKLKAKPYGPDSSPEEIQTMKDRVRLADEECLIFHEAPVPSTFQLDICFEEIYKIIQNKQIKYMILDLTEANRPGSEIRSHIREKWKPIKDQLKHVAVYTDKNFMVNMAAEFVFKAIGFNSFSIHKTKEQASKAIENARGKK